MRTHRDERGRRRRAAWTAVAVAGLVTAGGCGGPVGDPEPARIRTVLATTEPGERLQAAADYLWYHPRSPHRTELAMAVARGIAGIADAGRRIELGQAFLVVFDEHPDLDLIAPALSEAYFRLGQTENFLRIGRRHLRLHPDDVVLLTRLALIAFDQKAGSASPSFLPTGVEYASRAVGLIEADRRPPWMSEATWQTYRTRWLAILYRELGAQSLRAHNWADAAAKLEKAAALQPNDPRVFRLLGDLAIEQFRIAAQEAEFSRGPGAAEARRRALDRLDATIQFHARAIALAAGRPEFESVEAEVLPTLTRQYQQRYGTVDGLRALIERARTAPWPPERS